MHSSVLAGPSGAGLPLWHENGVCHRHIRGGVTVEDELRLHHPRVHPCGPRPRPGERNSVNACVTRAEIVTPDAWACARIRAATEAGSLTVNTTLPSGTSRRPV